MDTAGALQLFVMIVFGGLIYLIPTLVATTRHHHQANAIFVVNLFLGWMVVGWIAALVWALTAVKPELSKETTKKCPACAETVLKAAKVCRYCGKEFAA